MNEMRWIKILARMIALVLGSLLLGIGINGFLVPHQLLDGGIIGIALILHYYFDIPAGLWSAILSIPLIIYAWIKDRKQFHGSVYGMIVTAIFIDVLAPYQFILPIWLSAILGGAICGIAVGLMLRYETSTGGTDLIAYFLAKMTPINIGIIIAFIDVVIVLLGYQTLGLQSVVFSTITILVAGSLASVCYEKF
ncbi:YitT family protein [Niallia endozanthoxylica]|uniref:YitT family protein n=1 Tax=Niallia endozanthoxylica TaxID=2036016 RepID=UPI00168AE4CD|nr:YitT family protein [Niallia endozanthoxylica]